MKLKCKSCNQEIAVENINIQHMIAKCKDCGIVFGFAEDVPGNASPTVGSSRGRREKVPIPERFVVNDSGGGLHIQRRWFSPVFIFLIFFCLFWDGFLIVWYTIALGSDAPGGFSVVMALFPLIHVGVGVGLTYFTICGFVNRTNISVDQGSMTIKHGPLPWPGNHTLSVSDLNQLYVTEHVRRGKNGYSTTYRLNAKLRNGRELKLLASLNEANQALFLEQRLEDFMGIQDRPVPGEISKG